MSKDIYKLSQEVAEHLGLEEVEIKFEDTGEDDSRLYTKETYIAINNKFEDDYLECAKCIAHEYRHMFQFWFVKLFPGKIADRWKEEMSHQLNSENMNGDVNAYASQELELDAFAFTKFYLEKYEGIKVVNKIQGYDKVIDLYISKYRGIM